MKLYPPFFVLQGSALLVYSIASGSIGFGAIGMVSCVTGIMVGLWFELDSRSLEIESEIEAAESRLSDGFKSASEEKAEALRADYRQLKMELNDISSRLQGVEDKRGDNFL